LNNILLALSNSVPEVGYIQGLNSIVAIFLMKRIKEENIYWILKYMLNKLNLKILWET
jgi:hypothetical protein